ncbi:MAG: RNA polymerase sigma factor [Streptosporangiaceae bacterium]
MSAGVADGAQLARNSPPRSRSCRRDLSAGRIGARARGSAGGPGRPALLTFSVRRASSGVWTCAARDPTGHRPGGQSTTSRCSGTPPLACGGRSSPSRPAAGRGRRRGGRGVRPRAGARRRDPRSGALAVPDRLPACRSRSPGERRNPEPGPDPDQALAPAAGLASLVPALRQLSPGERAAVVLHYEADLPVQEIARRMGTSAGTVKVHLFRGRRRLRELLGDDEVDDA